MRRLLVTLILGVSLASAAGCADLGISNPFESTPTAASSQLLGISLPAGMELSTQHCARTTGSDGQPQGMETAYGQADRMQVAQSLFNNMQGSGWNLRMSLRKADRIMLAFENGNRLAVISLYSQTVYSCVAEIWVSEKLADGSSLNLLPLRGEGSQNSGGFGGFGKLDFLVGQENIGHIKAALVLTAGQKSDGHRDHPVFFQPLPGNTGLQRARIQRREQQAAIQPFQPKHGPDLLPGKEHGAHFQRPAVRLRKADEDRLAGGDTAGQVEHQRVRLLKSPRRFLIERREGQGHFATLPADGVAFLFFLETAAFQRRRFQTKLFFHFPLSHSSTQAGVGF